MRRQQDAQTRRMNQLETSLKTAADKHSLWRNRVAAKQTELDSMRSAHGELQSQIASMKSAQRMSTAPSSSSPNKSASRITPAAERKLVVTQNQLAAAEARAEEARARQQLEEAKYKEKVRELETQLSKRPSRPSVTGGTATAAAPRPSSGVVGTGASTKDTDKERGREKEKEKETGGAWSDYRKELKNQIRRTKEEMERTKRHQKKLDDLLGAAGPDGDALPSSNTTGSEVRPESKPDAYKPLP